MNDDIIIPPDTAPTVIAPAHLRLLHDAAGWLGGSMGLVIQLATLGPWHLDDLMQLRLEAIDFSTGIATVPTKGGETAEVALSARAIDLIVKACLGDPDPLVLRGVGPDYGTIAVSPEQMVRLKLVLIAIDPRLAELEWSFDMVRRSIRAHLRLAGTPHAVIEAQSATGPHARRGCGRDRMLMRQKAAAELCVGLLRLHTLPASNTVLRPCLLEEEGNASEIWLIADEFSGEWR